jgi:hypothetical protein
MKDQCKNPDCPIHGTSPDAVRDRGLRQHIITNGELMSVIRIMAANVHSNVLVEAGVREGFVEEHMQMQILKGNHDDDPVVQGIMQGFIVMLRDHYPTQQYVGLCAAVPESENCIKMKTGKHPDEVQDLPFHVITLDELMAMLDPKRHRRH